MAPALIVGMIGMPGQNSSVSGLLPDEEMLAGPSAEDVSGEVGELSCLARGHVRLPAGPVQAQDRHLRLYGTLRSGRL